MRQLTKYAFANAKIRAMLSYLLTSAYMQQLLESRDIYEVKEALSKTAYKDIIQKLGEGELSLLERELMRYDVSMYRKIQLMLATKREKEFIALLSQRYEIEQLKVALRVWHKKIIVDLNQYVLGEKINFDIDFEKIVLCQNIEEIILLLDETSFKKPLMKARSKFKERSSLFYLEVALDIDYYQRLLVCIDKFSSVDRKIARKIIGIEVDAENISWLVRLRKYYNLGMGEILDWVIPGGDKIDKDSVRRFYASDGLTKVVESIAFGPYLKVKDLVEENIFLIEQFLHELMLREVRRALAGFPFTIGTVLGYLVLKRRETKNLISLCYAKYFGLERQETNQLLQSAP